MNDCTDAFSFSDGGSLNLAGNFNQCANSALLGLGAEFSRNRSKRSQTSSEVSSVMLRLIPGKPNNCSSVQVKSLCLAKS